jgi:hypothetical protein
MHRPEMRLSGRPAGMRLRIAQLPAATKGTIWPSLLIETGGATMQETPVLCGACSGSAALDDMTRDESRAAARAAAVRMLAGRRHGRQALARLCIGILIAAVPARAGAAGRWTLIGWNNLGMHCMDPDYGVFALLPPYNTVQAQLIDPDGRLVRDPAGITVTYEAVADPDGSINRTSRGKTNFWRYVQALFGVAVPEDEGLNGAAMPGQANVPQPLRFEAASAAFIAEGIPITPKDDAGATNSYPLMRLVARDATDAVLASADVVLPVSEELNCKTCHTSDSSVLARPFEGWVHDPDPERDVRLNILRLHDDFQLGTEPYTTALATAGYDADGLFANATAGTPVLCARCHASEALPGSGRPGVSALTRAVHHRMASVPDPLTGRLLDDNDNRSACYRCHPGAVTRCLRGVMGAAVAPDGTPAIQCQSCHGHMRDVAAPERTGWLDEPACQSCHTGTALHNAGALRYTSAFTDDGTVRQPADDTFATTPDVPAVGLSLYRFSTGHGGLRCEACHGATHAEYASTERNDNLQSEQLQGHVGTLVECTACHAAVPQTVDGGPHGMHPVGAAWVARHPDAAEEGGAQRCRSCHGADYRGTVLSRVKGDRVLDTDFGRKDFWRGFQVGCYTCHLGPGNADQNPNRAPIADDAEVATTADVPIDLALQARDADGDPLALRIVSQASHGSVALSGTLARYIPGPAFAGADSFTFAASDGSTDGNLATVRVVVAAAPPVCVGDCNADRQVTIDELVRAVNIALDLSPLAACSACDASHDGQVTVDELVRAVNAALSGCPPEPQFRFLPREQFRERGRLGGGRRYNSHRVWRCDDTTVGPLLASPVRRTADRGRNRNCGTAARRWRGGRAGWRGVSSRAAPAGPSRRS